MITRTIVGGFFAECPDCGGRRYRTGSDVNRYGQGYVLFTCESACDEGLADLDIDLDEDEEWTVEVDETGRSALYIWQIELTGEDD